MNTADNEKPAAEKRGYLREDFRLFHINDRRSMDFDSHSHDFHKLILCLGGSVTYLIEGKTYTLSARDVLFVPKDKIHHSKTDASYERIVLFIDDGYLDQCAEDGALSTCFHRADKNGTCLFHADSAAWFPILDAAQELEEASSGEGFCFRLLAKTAFIRLMIYVNRLALCDSGIAGTVEDEKTHDIISYINAHYDENLTIERLAQTFYISRSSLIHHFKNATGGSVHSYINQKRLTAALALLRGGTSAAEAARLCGFPDYTVFYRGFKRMYGYPPSETKPRQNGAESARSK